MMGSGISMRIVGKWHSRSDAEMLHDLVSMRLKHMGTWHRIAVEVADVDELAVSQTLPPADLCVILAHNDWIESGLEMLCRSSALGEMLWFAVQETQGDISSFVPPSDTAYLVFTYSGSLHSFVDALSHMLEKTGYVGLGVEGDAGAGISLVSGGGDIATHGAMIDKRQGTFFSGEFIALGESADRVIAARTTSSQAEQLSFPGMEVRLLAPVFPTAYAYHLDSDDFPFVVCRIDNRSVHPITVAVKCTIEDCGVPTSQTTDVPEHMSIDVTLLPMLKREVFPSLTEIRPATLRVVATLLGGRENIIFYDQSHRIHLQARDIAVLALRSPTGRVTSLLPYLASWVTPHHPSIEQLARRAADYLPNGSTFGYDLTGVTLEESRLTIRDQVKAIFQALKRDVKLTYVDSSLSFGCDPHQVAQRVRLPAHVLAMGGPANCIDGAVLYASLLELLSLQPILVIVPGHAFVGWKIWPNCNEFEFLETTWTRTEDFEVALQGGEQAYRSAREHSYFEHDLFDPAGFARLIDVSDCRNRGIYPLE